jgi:hypothetical protein
MSEQMFGALFRFVLFPSLICFWSLFQVNSSLAVGQQDQEPPTPLGLKTLASDYGLNFYRKDYPNGNPDYIQALDLSKGANLILMHAPIREVLPGKGQFGGDDARFESRSLKDYWRSAKMQNENTFCVTNGSFFYMLEYPTRLPFSLKVDGEIVTEGFGGYGPQAYIGQRLMLELWDDHADIRELTASALNNSTATNIIAGLMEDANKNAKKAVARTFVGIQDIDQDGKFETLYLLNTSTAVQTEVAATLRDLGAEKIMMLDGGGSTQLICDGEWVIESERLIPQAIATYAGVPPLVSGELKLNPDWSLLLTGQNYPLQFEIQNTGVLTWTQEDTQMILSESNLSDQISMTLSSQVAPGETTVITRSMSSFSEAGVYPIQVTWDIIYQDEVFSGKPFTVTSVVLPERMAKQMQEVKEVLLEWQSGTAEDASEKLEAWLIEQEATKTPKKKPTSDASQTPIQGTRQPIDTQFTDPDGDSYHPIFKDILIIPLAMSPLLIMIALAIAKIWEDRR